MIAISTALILLVVQIILEIMALRKEGLSIALSLCCGLFFYILFGLALKMPLYPGMIGAVLFG
jgi:hypothetical protein